jgi:hypothetical protein
VLTVLYQNNDVKSMLIVLYQNDDGESLLILLYQNDGVKSMIILLHQNDEGHHQCLLHCTRMMKGIIAYCSVPE